MIFNTLCTRKLKRYGQMLKELHVGSFISSRISQLNFIALCGAFQSATKTHLIKRCCSLRHSEIINRAVEDLLVVLHQPSDQQSLLHLRFSIQNPHRFVIPRFHFCIDPPPFLLIFHTFAFPCLCDCLCRGQRTRSASHLLACHDV